MKSVFEILEERKIPHNIKLDEFLYNYFHFLPSIDPSILDQMTAEEICEHQEFWNNDCYMPIKFLLENNKVSLNGFKNIMRTEYYYINSTEAKMEEMYQLLEDFIRDNKVDITDYFSGEYIYQQLEDILRYKTRIGTDVYLDNLNLEKALENSDSIAVLLFGFKSCDLPTRRERMMEYICENFELISKKFFEGNNSYKVSPSLYIRDNCEFEARPLFEVASYIQEKYGLLDERFKTKSLIKEYVSGLLNREEVEKLKSFLEDIKEEFPLIYSEASEHRLFKKHFLESKTLEIEGLSVEKLHDFLDNCTDTDRHIVSTDLQYYIEVNKTGFNYDYSKGKYFSEYTKEFLEYQLDESIRMFNLKKEFAKQGKKEPITSHWRWNDFTQTIMRDVINLCVKKDEWIDLIEKALNCEMYQEYLSWYAETNGDLKLLNYINEYQPQLIKKMNHEVLIKKIIVAEHNKFNY